MEVNLTNREVEVYHLILRGYPLQEIADNLIVERSTVQSHTDHILQKFAVSSRLELLANRIEELEKEIKVVRNKL